uniref:Reverse transcriptase zinc-binding domain-containing protein n=1 Tax=Triticum urartu TaxID=4572 RepID=A0A8R7PLG1_TRIUA
GQGASRPNPIWDILWKLKVPSKIKIFIWKALHGTVSGKAVLAARYIPVSLQCPVCSTGLEDICHLLFTCPRARCIWEALGLHDVIKNALIVDRSGSVVFEYILCNQNRQSPILGTLGLQESIVAACWYIWWQRRELEKGELVAGPPRTAFAVQALMSNYGFAAPDSKPPEISWTKP